MKNTSFITLTYIKVLHAYLQPKDIPEVTDHLDEIPCDKLLIQYYPYPHPHRILREFMIEHKEYTHLAIHTNDLVVTISDYDKMMMNLFNHPFLEVIAGVCNVDQEGEKDVWNVCFNLPTLDIKTRVYHWVKKGGFNGIQRVRFAGFPYMWVKREILENIDSNSQRPIFDGTDLFGKDGYSADLWFSHGLYHSNIPIYCDSNIEMKHLRYFGEMQVGRKPTQTIWVKDGIAQRIPKYDMGVMQHRVPREYNMDKLVKIRQGQVEEKRISKYA